MTPPHHYIHHTFFTSDSTYYTTYATPFNHQPTPILPYLIYILLQFTTNNTLFTSDPTHNPTCATPLPSLTPPPPPCVIYSIPRFPFDPTLSVPTQHPFQFWLRPQLYLCHTFIFCPSPILSIPQLLLTWHNTPSHLLFTGIVNLLKMLLCFLLFINLCWSCYWKLIMKSIEGL